jgi:hypothetical protein
VVITPPWAVTQIPIIVGPWVPPEELHISNPNPPPIVCTEPNPADCGLGSGEDRVIIVDADRFRVFGEDGILIEGGGTNYCVYSEQLDNQSGWEPVQGVGSVGSVSANHASCPLFDGARMDLATITSGANVYWRQPAALALKTNFSAYFAAPSGTGTKEIWFGFTCSNGAELWTGPCVRSDSGSCSIDARDGYWIRSNGTVGESIVRFSQDMKCASGSAYVYIGVPATGSDDGEHPTSFCVAGMQMTHNEYGAKSYVPTASTNVSSGADIAYLDANLFAGKTNWCATVKAKPMAEAAWNLMIRPLWSAGTISAANTASQIAQLNGNLDFNHINGSTQSRLFSGAHGLDPIPESPRGNGIKTEARLLFSTMDEVLDGVTMSGSESGAGDKTWGSLPTRVYLGQTSAADEFFYGFLRDFNIYAGDCL